MPQRLGGRSMRIHAGRSAGVAALVRRVPVRGLRDQILHELGMDIVSGRYPEQSALPLETDIPARFGASRTVIREAVNALAAKGMVEARARTGTRVLPRENWTLFDADVLAWHFAVGPDVHFLRSLAEIRICVELEASALAAGRRTERQLRLMEEALAKMDEAATTELFAAADLEFHSVIADASANPFMASINALVRVALAAAFTMSSPVADSASKRVTVDRHRRIAKAIRDGNAQAAREAMHAVIWEGFARAEARAR